MYIVHLVAIMYDVLLCLQVEEQYIRKLQFDSRIRILEQSWEKLFLQITHRYVSKTSLRRIVTCIYSHGVNYKDISQGI